MSATLTAVVYLKLRLESSVCRLDIREKESRRLDKKLCLERKYMNKTKQDQRFTAPTLVSEVRDLLLLNSIGGEKVQVYQSYIIETQLAIN